jgi:hypothetical protein
MPESDTMNNQEINMPKFDTMNNQEINMPKFDTMNNQEISYLHSIPKTERSDVFMTKE